jgi:NADPH:quinone reductase-like Zn-dependent oxidoreductase
LLRAIFERRLKPIICSARADILDGLARAAGAGKLRLPISEIVPLSDAMEMLTALERGRRSNGKVLVRMN